MGYLKYIKELYEQPKENLGDILKQRLIKIRKEGAILRIDHPTRPDRARSLGYKAKQGYLVVRVKLRRGGRMRQRFKSGRRPKAYRRKKIVSKSYKWIAEERAIRRYNNCEVLGSYFLAKDGLNYWFEVIIADRIQASRYKGMEWLKNGRGRVFRGKTSSGKKSRGLK